jgi:hypothetical protein
MGSYLSVGLVVAVKTNCKVIGHMEQLRKELIDETKLALGDYVVVQDEEGYFHFTLKDECYGENLANFMKEQIKLSNRAMPDALVSLAGIKCFKDLKNMDNSLKLQPFQLLTFGEYWYESGDKSKVTASLEAITFARDGKILLEQGEWIFEYFEKNIHLQAHFLAKYVKINIS